MKSIKLLKKIILLFVGGLILSVSCNCMADAENSKCKGYVRVSKKNPLYFELTTGEPYIPCGMNICFPRFLTDEEEVFADYEKKFKMMSEAGGNYARIWLSAPFWEIEDSKQGEYNQNKLKRIDKLFDLADKYGIRLKLCFENFIYLKEREKASTFSSAPPFDKQQYLKVNGGSFENTKEFFTTQKGKEVFLARCKIFADRYKDRKCVFGWELWNESWCIQCQWDMSKRLDILKKWHAQMLPEVKKLFPNHMVMISMPSFDKYRTRSTYAQIIPDPNNDVAQIHNYLNEGNALPVSKGPTDIMCADAINELRKIAPNKPLLLAEVGAAEPNHVGGPSRYYKVDTNGILHTDQMLVPFFCGSAGNGMSWHWEYYITKHNLWGTFARFSKAIEGINPLEEDFKPFYVETENLRVYVIIGNKTVLAYCRDKNNWWGTELRDKQPPKDLLNETINIFDIGGYGVKKASVFKPYELEWSNVAINKNAIKLPPFKRAIVIKLEK